MMGSQADSSGGLHAVVEVRAHIGETPADGLDTGETAKFERPHARASCCRGGSGAGGLTGEPTRELFGNADVDEDLTQVPNVAVVRHVGGLC